MNIDFGYALLCQREDFDTGFSASIKPQLRSMAHHIFSVTLVQNKYNSNLSRQVFFILQQQRHQ